MFFTPFLLFKTANYLIIHSFSDKVTTEEANTSMKDLLCGLYSSLVGDGRKQGRGHDWAGERDI